VFNYQWPLIIHIIIWSLDLPLLGVNGWFLHHKYKLSIYSFLPILPRGKNINNDTCNTFRWSATMVYYLCACRLLHLYILFLSTNVMLINTNKYFWRHYREHKPGSDVWNVNNEAHGEDIYLLLVAGQLRDGITVPKESQELLWEFPDVFRQELHLYYLLCRTVNITLI
jgi:hypothetical protein